MRLGSLLLLVSSTHAADPQNFVPLNYLGKFILHPDSTGCILGYSPDPVSRIAQKFCYERGFANAGGQAGGCATAVCFQGHDHNGIGQAWREYYNWPTSYNVRQPHSYACYCGNDWESLTYYSSCPTTGGVAPAFENAIANSYNLNTLQQISCAGQLS